MNHDILVNEIIRVAREFNTSGLSAGTSGNISVLTDNIFIITPSGLPYDEMTAKDLVVMDRDGNVISGVRKPSTEWRIHRDIYNIRDEARAVVHTHSPYATAIACIRQNIPAFHYMIALAGGDSIRCTEYATFGTAELSTNTIFALQDRRACLLANHGVVTIGMNLVSAFNMALITEELAKQYWLCRMLGQPVLLDEAEIKRNLDKFKTYGL